MPENVADFFELTNGADYYGRGGHRADFDFLLSGETNTSLEEMNRRALCAPTTSAEQQLNCVVSRLKSMGMEAVAIDLTTDELRDVGLWVVRVVIPELMPISFIHRARYLGTPRLYDYARRFRPEVTSEKDINPGPMPFA